MFAAGPALTIGSMSTPIPQQHYVDLPDGLRIHYNQAGQASKVALFLHGSGPGASGYSNFKLNFPWLAHQGWRCIVPDLPGYGLSSKPADREYVLDFFVQTLHAFLSKLDITRCVLIGNSLGGAIAMKYTLDHPEQVTQLVLMGPGGLEERETYFRMEGIQRMMSDFAGGVLDREGMRRLLTLLVHDPKHVTDALLDERVPVVQTQPKEVLATMRVPNLSDRLGELRVPVLGFWGTNDRFCPATGAMKVMEHCPNAEFVLVNRCGHWVMVEHSELFNHATLDFLKRHSA
jgi:4,5:9,10-diseco-3-hydroxy-5,9,17-trioxoandrosta-1(10),2-diene-4-oate hydrolase